MSIRHAASTLLFASACVFLPTMAFAQFMPLVTRENGETLFTKEWKPNDNYDETGPDGLGPMFNANSCVACHNLGGIGGAGDNSTNVQILTALPRQTSSGKYRTDDLAIRMMFENASRLHPEFTNTNSMILHRSSTDETRFANWQKETLEFRSLKKVNGERIHEKLLAERTKLLEDATIYRVKKEDARNRYTLQISRRNTPALFGVSTIELISDDQIRAIALKQSKQTGPVKGVVAELPNGKLGKFGWRGDKATVEEFTVQACAIELGLSNSKHDQAGQPYDLIDEDELALSTKVVEQQSLDRPSLFVLGLQSIIPARPHPCYHKPEKQSLVSRKKTGGKKVMRPTKKREHDMTDVQMDDLVSFVNSLDPLIPKTARTDAELESVVNGSKHFDSIGCADCHVRNVGPAANVFSDFLMHDMGESLADAAGALELAQGPDQIRKRNARAWQTPPLWGVALSAPYLHDGRATDLQTAIAMHGGEAVESAQQFSEMPKDERKELLSFLNTLGDGSHDQQTGQPPSVAAGGWSSPQPRRGKLAGRRR